MVTDPYKIYWVYECSLNSLNGRCKMLNAPLTIPLDCGKLFQNMACEVFIAHQAAVKIVYYR